MNLPGFRQLFLPVCVLALAAGAHTASAQSAPSASAVAAYTGLHKAAHEGDTDAILALIDAGADVDVRDSKDRTPLIVSAFASHDDSFAALANAGADLDALEYQAYDVVTITAVANDVDLLNLALELGANSGNVTSPYDGTALIAAAHLGHFEVVEALIEADAPLDHVNNLNWTALIEAVILGNGQSDHIKTVKLLLDAGADKTITDGQGVSALEHAQSRGYEEIVEIFK